MVKTIFKFIRLIQISVFFFPGLSLAFTIEEAVDLALTSNLNLQKQQLNRNFSENDLKEKKSQMFGRIDLVSTYSHFNLPRTLVPLTPASIMDNPSAVSTTSDLFFTGIMYEATVFTGFARKRSIEIAALQKELVDSTTRLSREELIYNVKTIYVNILALQAQYEAQQSYIRALQGIHDIISREMFLGKRARVEQLKAAAAVENANAQASQISGDIKIAEAALAGLLNIDTLPVLETIDINVALHSENDCLHDIKNLERYRVKNLTVEKNQKLLGKSKASYFPQIAFNTFYGQNYGPADPSTPENDDWNSQEVWQASVNLKWNIFDFGGKKSEIQKAEIRKQQSLLEKRNTEIEIIKSTIKANAEIDTAISRYHSAEAELALTREMEAIEQVRFDKGAISMNDFLYAKAQNQQALSRFITAGYAYQNAQFYLDYLMEKGERK